jgi:hypothetical protein
MVSLWIFPRKELGPKYVPAIRDEPGNPVLKWVESIKSWISGDGPSESDQLEDGDDGVSEGDIIARAKGTRPGLDWLDYSLT